MTTTLVKLSTGNDRVRRFLAGKRIQAKGRTEVDVMLTDLELRSLRRKAPEAFLAIGAEAEAKAPAVPAKPTTKVEARADADAKASGPTYGKR